MPEEMHAIIKGRVHGVGFRATTKFLADKLKLTGFAKNLPNGDVEICVQGERAHLEKLIEDLKQEFDENYIRKIEIKYRASSASYAGFKIL